ncbi:MAG: hypothetical protein ABSE71_02520 [Candidatus Micrarchaeaceae archaeon]|jgi:hypothetical protein|nr:hypothetical protein [Candidatus Micrarchaeota archaeon]HII09781.1 hypothetical protein [Candidatus Micrarchaeota archaeon]
MAKNDVDRVTDEKVAKGGVLVKFYFDIQDTDKSKLQPLLVDLINSRLMKERGVVYCHGSIEEPIENKGIYITSAMVTVLFDSFMPLVNIAFNYAPAGIEILRPTGEMTFKIHELQGMLMDMANISVIYSKYIIENVMKGENLEKLKQQVDERAETGRQQIEKKDDK